MLIASVSTANIAPVRQASSRRNAGVLSRPTPVAGILALAIPYAGILGRIYSEILVDVPQQPLNALRASGASEFKVFLYGRLPMALPDMLSYTFYRLECAVRSAAILSFVGITGLGYQIRLSIDWTGGLLHPGGAASAAQIFSALFH